MKKTVFIRDFAKGRPVKTQLLVRNQTRKTARTGNDYLDLELQDSSGVIGAKLWDCDRVGIDFESDNIVTVQGTPEEYQGNLQFRIEGIRKAGEGEFDLRDFLPAGTADPEKLYAALLERVGRIQSEPLRALLEAILEDPSIASRYKLAPAAMTYHHSYLGGLLEHVSSLLELGDRISDHYPSLDRDLLMAGLILHDIGKIEELDYHRAFRYSTRGQLIGHITIGLEIVHEKMRDVPDFPALLRDQLDHIILSHHGQLEFGSPKLPMFPEALAVHFLDNLDSKLESMRAQYEAERNRDGEFTSRNRALGVEQFKRARERGSQTTKH